METSSEINKPRNGFKNNFKTIKMIIYRYCLSQCANSLVFVPARSEKNSVVQDKWKSASFKHGYIHIHNVLANFRVRAIS